jgi:hypothetical protein
MGVPNLPNWDVHLAQLLGIQPTPAVRHFFNLWSRAEGGDADNNPFNTTMPGFGTIGSYNSVGVKRYGNPMAGLQATAATLKNGRYGNILSALAQGTDPHAMAEALANSPWGTGELVLKMLGSGAGAETAPNQAPAPQPGLPGLPGTPSIPKTLGALLRAAAPSPTSVQLLAPLGGTAAKAAQAAQAPIPLPKQESTPALPGLPGSDSGAATQLTQTMVPMAGATHGGMVPMVTGGDIRQKYPNLSVQSQVDWQHINPRLLNILQKEAEKRGVAIVINSGYRSRAYNSKIGGAQNSNHTRGLAVDAYINGHPIGDVIGPDEWAKLGVRSGNTPGFFRGQPDPEHLDIVGIPVKTGGK